MIEVTRIGSTEALEFDVRVTGGGGESRHRVTMGGDDAARLGAPSKPPEAVIEAAFRFLLDREPKESILGHFDVTVISRYFPEFEAELPRYLEQS